MNIIHFDELDSTNNYAKSNIDDLADKTVISTDIQTKGRGRFTRSWVDLGPDNIFMTFVLKPSKTLLPVYSNLTQYLSVILCKQLEEMGLGPKIKWPNDVLLSDKKVCGILAESVIKQGKLKGLVLGIGVNLNAAKNDLDNIDIPANAINIELGKPVNKQEFINKLIEKFFADYESFLEDGFTKIKPDYEKRASLKLKNQSQKQKVKISVFDKIKEGFFYGFDDDGSLILEDFSGLLNKFNMGEIIICE